MHPLRAPYAGVITIINRANGQFVQQAGSRGTDFVLKIEDLSELFIQADANDVDVVKLHTGQLASIKISAVPNKIFGVNSVFFHITNKTLQKGNFFRSILNRFSTGCVIGSGVAEQLFGEAGVTSSIGQIIKIGRDENTFTCKITGVLSEESSGNSDENLAIYLPYEYFIAVHTLPWLKSIHTFTVKLKNNNETIAAGKAIKKYFTSKYGNTGDFFVDANLILIHQMNEFITLSTLVLIATATLSLLVGGVGIVNMMLTSVQQRIKEIGVRKAFGATNLSIRTQFLLETIYICLFGGVLGIIIGFVMYEMIIFIVSQFFPAVKFQFFYHGHQSYFLF